MEIVETGTFVRCLPIYATYKRERVSRCVLNGWPSVKPVGDGISELRVDYGP